MSLLGLATIARRRGDPAAAAVHLDAAWAMGRTQTVPLMRSLALVARGYTADQQGDAVSALELQVAALPVVRRIGAVRALANSIEGLAGALATTGTRSEAEHAARMLGLADAMRRRSGGAMPSAERFDVDRAERRARGTLGDQAFSCAFEAGSAADAHAATADRGMDRAVAAAEEASAVAAAEAARPG